MKQKYRRYKEHWNRHSTFSVESTTQHTAVVNGSVWRNCFAACALGFASGLKRWSIWCVMLFSLPVWINIANTDDLSNISSFLLINIIWSPLSFYPIGELHSFSLKFTLFIIWFNSRSTFFIRFYSIELVNFHFSAFTVNHFMSKENNHRWSHCVSVDRIFLQLDLQTKIHFFKIENFQNHLSIISPFNHLSHEQNCFDSIAKNTFLRIAERWVKWKLLSFFMVSCRRPIYSILVSNNKWLKIMQHRFILHHPSYYPSLVSTYSHSNSEIVWYWCVSSS